MEGESNNRLRLILFGGFRAQRGDSVIPESAWERPTAKTLVKLLALEPLHRLHQDQIQEILWPDLAPASAAHSLRKAVHRARRALEPERIGHSASRFLTSAGGVIALDPDTVQIDVDWFERLAREALAGDDLDAYERALAAAGDLLPEDRYEDWAVKRREALDELATRVRRGYARVLSGQGAIEAAADVLRQLVERDPVDEDAHRELMRLFAASGNRPRAIRQYQACREALDRELNVEPAPETTALYQSILETSAPVTATPDVVAPPFLPAVLRRMPRTPLVGREHARRQLADALGSSIGGSGDTWLVSGEVGVGKSRLAEEIAYTAAEQGVIVLWGAGYRRDSVVPYRLFIDALGGLYSTRPQAERQAAASRYPALARLIPALTVEAASGEVPESGSLFASIVRALTDLTQFAPLLLVLDDLHDADAASLQVLEHLLRLAGDHRWLILGTYRQQDVRPGSSLHRIITTGLREHRCHGVSLLRLGRADCDRLAAALLPDGPPDERLLSQLWELTLGNPLFVRELLQSWQDEGGIQLCDGSWHRSAGTPWGVSPVPGSIRDMVEVHVRSLGEATGEVLGLAATAGMVSSLRTLRAVSRQSDLSLLDALDRAVAGGILEEREEGYAFQHPLFRDALYEGLSHHRRLVLHRALGAAIERESPEDVDVLAYHFQQGQEPERAAHYLERAGDRARGLFGRDVAARYYSDALDLLRQLNRPRNIARLEEKLALVAQTGQEGTSVAPSLATSLVSRDSAGEMAGVPAP